MNEGAERMRIKYVKYHLLACLGSALLGGVITASWLQEDRASFLTAQDQRFPANRPGVPADPPPVDSPSLPDADQEYTPEERVNVAVYEHANRGVVHITTRTVVQEFFFETPREGSGAGSVLDRRGYILTNYHVVEGARNIRVTLYDGSDHEAGLVGQDPVNDIAVLRIEAPAELLHPIPLGDSSNLRVGQRVFAIGNPFGLERTMTVGIISSLNRTLPSRQKRSMQSIIQIDAALNQGNSGGPLLNSQARLIGMNTAIASSTGENTGVGFAIPVSTIARVVPQLIETGRVIRPDSGIVAVLRTNQGLVIVNMAPGGPAEQAGLRGFRVVRRQSRRGPFVYDESRVDRDYADVMVAVDGKPVRTVDDFLNVIESRHPGDEVIVTVLREDRRVDVPLRLGGTE
jgi:S1-C subfamily serine protease